MSIRTASSNPAYRRDGGTPPPMAVQPCPDTVAQDRVGDGNRRYGFCCAKGPRQAHARLLTTMSTGRCLVAASAHCLRMWGTGPTGWFCVTGCAPCHAWPEFVQDKEAQLHRPACPPNMAGADCPGSPPHRESGCHTPTGTGRSIALPKWIADHCGVRDRWVRPGPMAHPTGWEHIAPRRHSPPERNNCPHTACLCAVLRICRLSANTLRREARQPRIGDTPCRGSALCSRQALPRSRGHHGPAPNTLTDRSTSQTCST